MYKLVSSIIIESREQMEVITILINATCAWGILTTGFIKTERGSVGGIRLQGLTGLFPRLSQDPTSKNSSMSLSLEIAY